MKAISIAGHVGSVKDLRYTAAGVPVLDFNVAVREYKRDEEDGTLWFHCAMWGSRGEALANTLKVGMGVAVSGDLSLNEWTGQDGQAHTDLQVRARDVSILKWPEGNSDNGGVTPEGVGADHERAPF